MLSFNTSLRSSFFTFTQVSSVRAARSDSDPPKTRQVPQTTGGSEGNTALKAISNVFEALSKKIEENVAQMPSKLERSAQVTLSYD